MVIDTRGDSPARPEEPTLKSLRSILSAAGAELVLAVRDLPTISTEQDPKLEECHRLAAEALRAARACRASRFS